MESQYPDSHPRSNPPHLDLHHFVFRAFEVHALHPDCCLYVLWDLLRSIIEYENVLVLIDRILMHDVERPESDLQPFRHHYRLSILFFEADFINKDFLNIIQLIYLVRTGLCEYNRVSTTVFVVEQCHFP